MAIEAGADALGFNFFPGSKRYVRYEEIEPWLRTLPPFVSRVAVTVNASEEEILTLAKSPFLEFIQLHGDETPAFCRGLIEGHGVPIIKAVALQSRNEFEKIAEYESAGVQAVLVDAFVPGEFGGTGKLINLKLASELAASGLKIPLILSGGLNPGNVADAVTQVNPFAVDVASGVEGINAREKDPERVRSFILNANAGDF